VNREVRVVLPHPRPVPGRSARLTGCGKTHALYQGTALAGPLTSREEGFSPWAFSWRPSGKIKEFVRDASQQGLKSMCESRELPNLSFKSGAS
jgi:hypothetical protein